LDIYFFREACKVYFVDIPTAQHALQHLNATTNLIATFFKGEGKSNSSDNLSSENETNLFRDSRDMINENSMLVRRNSSHLAAGPRKAFEGLKSTPKGTLHVSNITKDRADLLILFQEYEGFVKVAYYPNWVFVCFDSPDSAGKAIERIHSTTRMQASFAQVEYTPSFVRPPVGVCNSVLHVCNFPSNAHNAEFTKVMICIF